MPKFQLADLIQHKHVLFSSTIKHIDQKESYYIISFILLLISFTSKKSHLNSSLDGFIEIIIKFDPSDDISSIYERWTETICSSIYLIKDIHSLIKAGGFTNIIISDTKGRVYLNKEAPGNTSTESKMYLNILSRAVDDNLHFSNYFHLKTEFKVLKIKDKEFYIREIIPEGLAIINANFTSITVPEDTDKENEVIPSDNDLKLLRYSSTKNPLNKAVYDLLEVVFKKENTDKGKLSTATLILESNNTIPANEMKVLLKNAEKDDKFDPIKRNELENLMGDINDVSVYTITSEYWQYLLVGVGCVIVILIISTLLVVKHSRQIMRENQNRVSSNNITKNERKSKTKNVN